VGVWHGLIWSLLRELYAKHFIKVIKPGFEVEGVDVLELFKREVQTLRSIRHYAIVSYNGDSHPYLCSIIFRPIFQFIINFKFQPDNVIELMLPLQIKKLNLSAIGSITPVGIYP